MDCGLGHRNMQWANASVCQNWKHCCDRPASLGVTRCAHYKWKDSPCLECLVRAPLCRLEKMIEEVVYTPYIDRIAKNFFTKLSKPTAAQWTRGPGSTGDALALGRSRARAQTASRG
ncbi:hypothetical protein I308_101182 [Cryptococcus tetragattii IND107]|uniref:Uncharacterized protein n=1 Tax=Cryptococcus tetragattii IND107 TaxID=1296105 RepID=A0ABR3BZJ7_9TREE